MIARFGIYEVDVGRVEVRCGGVPVSVQPQVFSVIEFLLVHRDRVVSKEELLDSVWGDRFVSESALTSRIKSARRALGDSGEAQAVIRTVVGRGYRWVADLEPDGGAEAAGHGEPDAASTPNAIERTWSPPPWAAPANSFVGRGAEVAELAESLREARLVTLLGPGGVGKTRLAMSAVERFGGEVVVVELASVERDADVVAAVASHLGLESRTDDVLAAVVARLALDEVLVVLDNCEHVLGSVRGLVEAILRSTSMTRVLTTSRRRIGLADERVQCVEPLDRGEFDGAPGPAVQLLLDRLRQAGAEPGEHERQLAVEVCEILDGLPLALELAASRAAVFGLAELRSQLRAGLRILDAGVSDERRQSTMRALVEWSTGLLTDRGHEFFLGLSIFPSAFTLEAAGAVTGRDDVLTAMIELVESSLVDVDRRAQPVRYRMLEPVRQVAASHLAQRSELADELASSHASWVLSIGDAADAAKADDDLGPVQRLLVQSHADIRAACEHLSGRGDQEQLDRFARQLAEYVAHRPDVEMFRLIESIVSDDLDGRIALVELAASGQGDVVAAAASARALGEELSSGDPRWATLMHSAGIVHHYVGDTELGAAAFAAVIEADHPTRREKARAVASWTLAEAFGGRRGRARRIVEAHWHIVDGLRLSGLAACARAEAERDRSEMTLARLDEAARDAERDGATIVLRIVDMTRLALLVAEGRHDEAVRLGVPLIHQVLRAGTPTLAWNAIGQIAHVFDGGPDDELALLIRAAREADPRAVRAPAAIMHRNAERWKLSEELRGHAATEAIRRRGATMSVVEIAARLTEVAERYLDA